MYIFMKRGISDKLFLLCQIYYCMEAKQLVKTCLKLVPDLFLGGEGESIIFSPGLLREKMKERF